MPKPLLDIDPAKGTTAISETPTSSKRAEANRINVQTSTLPRSASGKTRSRLNALKHGLRAATPILPGEDPVAFEERLAAWTADLQPQDDVERFLVRRAVQLSWQLERADRALAARGAEGRLEYDEHVATIADEVADLGRRLFWSPQGPLPLYPIGTRDLRSYAPISWSGRREDPDDPARLVILLEATPLG